MGLHESIAAEITPLIPPMTMFNAYVKGHNLLLSIQSAFSPQTNKDSNLADVMRLEVCPPIKRTPLLCDKAVASVLTYMARNPVSTFSDGTNDHHILAENVIRLIPPLSLLSAYKSGNLTASRNEPTGFFSKAVDASADPSTNAVAFGPVKSAIKNELIIEDSEDSDGADLSTNAVVFGPVKSAINNALSIEDSEDSDGADPSTNAVAFGPVKSAINNELIIEDSEDSDSDDLIINAVAPGNTTPTVEFSDDDN
jgi:hypothetical protein